MANDYPVHKQSFSEELKLSLYVHVTIVFQSNRQNYWKKWRYQATYVSCFPKGSVNNNEEFNIQVQIIIFMNSS